MRKLIFAWFFILAYLVIPAAVHAYNSGTGLLDKGQYSLTSGGKTVTNPNNVKDNNLNTVAQLTGGKLGSFDELPYIRINFNTPHVINRIYMNANNYNTLHFDLDFYNSKNQKIAELGTNVTGNGVNTISYQGYTDLVTPLQDVKFIIINQKSYEVTWTIREVEFFGDYAAPVSQIVASPISHNAIKISWQEPDDANFNGVELEMIGGNIVTLPKGTKEYTFYGLQPETRYDFVISSINKNGNRSAGQSFFGVTLAEVQEPPPEISNLKSFVFADRIKFTWDNPPNVDHHEVRIYRDGVQIATAVTPANQFTDYGLQEHTTYTFVFFSVTTDGRKSEGISVTETTKGKPRGQVTGVNVQPGDGSAVISFFPHAEAEEYAIYLDGNKVASWTETSGVLTHLENFREYDVQVAAVNEWGEGPKSSPVTFAPEKVEIPAKPEVKAYVSKTTIRLEWNPVKFANLYRVYDDQNALVAELAGTQYKITGIQPGTTKKFFVTAVNFLGESEKAEITAVTSEGIDLTGVNLPFNVVDFLQAVFDFARLFGPYLVLALVLWFAPNIINFFKTAIDKRSKKGVK